jgi:hypothetical protein
MAATFRRPSAGGPPLGTARHGLPRVGRARRTTIRALAVAAAGVLLVVVPATAGAQPVVAPSLRAEAARLFRELAALRGLPAPGPPPRLVVRSREERRRYVAAELARRYPPPRLEAERRALIAWGLIPPAFDLGAFLTDLVVEQAAAYYDPVGKAMVLAPWLPPDEQAAALAHELVHALQDRQVPLDAFLAPVPGRSDATLARQALIEGEAVALSHDLGLRRQGQTLATLADVRRLQEAIERSPTGPVLGRAPAFLRTALTFPYAAGLGFVHHLARERGWAALSDLYADPPRSTAQILHPARYLDRREDPEAVVLPPLGLALGAGARRVIEDDLGEFTLGQVLAAGGAPVDVDGWRGDRYALWTTAGGGDVLVALVAWETAPRAAAFAEVFARSQAARHARGVAPAGAVGGPHVRDGRAFLVEARYRLVLVAEGVPVPALEAVRQAVWAGRPESRTPTLRRPAVARVLH